MSLRTTLLSFPGLLAAAGLLAGEPARAQASLLKDINPGPTSSLPARFVDVLGTTFFTAGSPGYGHALWKTDGTPAGTVLVKDFFPGPGGGVQPRELVALGELLLCIGEDGVHGGELWRSDGTTAGTYMIKDINPGNQGRPIYMDPPTGLTFFEGKIYFSVRDGVHGRELWSSDGTAQGTRMVLDIRKGGNTSDSMPTYFTPVGDTLYFFANDITHGWELWKTDGTAAGTRLVKDVWPGPEPTFLTHNSYPFDTGSLDDLLLFAAPDGTNGYELWKSDGTAQGTTLLHDITAGAASSRFYRNLRQAGPLAFFTADDGQTGLELWRTDGTTKGTVQVKDIQPGSGASSPGTMVAFGNRVVFGANDGTRGAELWRSDGTAAGTVLIRDIKAGAGDSMRYYSITKIGSRFAYFPADDGRVGAELWRTDGTAAGTTLVRDIAPGFTTSYPEFLTLSAGRVVFRAKDSAYGQEPRVVFPGATAQARGAGCSLPGLHPRLTATDPVLGAAFLVNGEAATASNPIALLLGIPGPPVLLPTGCRAYLSLAQPLILLAAVSSPTRGWGTQASVPSDTGLTGVSFALQAFQLLPGKSMDFDATNALVMTMGK